MDGPRNSERDEMKRPMLLGAVLGAMVIMHTAATLHRFNYVSRGAHTPERKEFSHSVDQIDSYTVIGYDETFFRADEWVQCGWVNQDRWFPHVGELEVYTAFLEGKDSARYNSRNFHTLDEAEQYLFAHDCPSNKWGRTASAPKGTATVAQGGK